MKYISVFIIILFVGNGILRAQDSSTTDNNVMLHAETGYTNFHAWKLSDEFIAGGGKRFPAFTTIRLGGLLSADYEKFRFEANWAFHYFLPFDNEALIGGQPIKSRLQGWEFMWCKDGIDVVPAKIFDVSGSIGFYAGNLRFEWNHRLYKNPFIAPALKIDTRLNIWKISIGARATYRFDLTAGNWKRKSPGMMELPDYKFREFQGMIYIGWILFE